MSKEFKIGFKQITNQYAQRCLTCEEPIEAGQRVNWTPGAGGIWHLSCEVPKNIATHVRAAEARRKLGLE